MSITVHTTRQVATLAGLDDLGFVRDVLEDLGHRPQTVNGALAWVLTKPQLKEAIEALQEEASEPDEDSVEDDDDFDEEDEDEDTDEDLDADDAESDER